MSTNRTKLSRLLDEFEMLTATEKEERWPQFRVQFEDALNELIDAMALDEIRTQKSTLDRWIQLLQHVRVAKGIAEVLLDLVEMLR